MAVVFALALGACDSGSGTGPGGVSEGEARALDDAAERLDRQQLPKSAVPPVELPVVERAPGGSSPPAVQQTPSEPTDDTAE